MSSGNLKAVPNKALGPKPHHEMPDVAHEARAAYSGTLDRVGMSLIEVPVRVKNADGDPVLLSAKADAYVNLIDPKAKGIHMSRLFITLQQRLEKEYLTPQLLEEILHEFVRSHNPISDSASVSLNFDYLVKRKALLSENTAWRSYPVSFKGTLTRGVMRLEMGVNVAYSSTCPCSAALARQLIQEKFGEEFANRDSFSRDEISAWLVKDTSIMATPHSQRSNADVRIVVDRASDAFSLIEIIDCVEDTLKTAVQAAVKREDEQEFARLNGQNMMFCEDAARRLKHWLEGEKRVVDYRIEARHVESLHPHDAVSIVTKGVEGGFRA